MPRPVTRDRMRRGLRLLLVPVLGMLGFAVALLAGIAIAKSFTLRVAGNATVKNASTGTTKHEPIVVNSHAFAVYMLSGDSKKHPKCKMGNGCFAFWPPVTVNSAKKLSKHPGIKGKLGTWHRDGFVQVTLGGHPLYTYAGDSHKRVATGEGIKTFGGTWSVDATSAGPTTTSTPSGTSNTTTSTPTYTYPYP